MTLVPVKIESRTSKGTRTRVSVVLEYAEGRIFFWETAARIKTPWGLKDEVKAMRGSHFHGYDDEGTYAKKMVWSVDDCQRNRFQLGYLIGEDVYAWFDRPLVRHEYRRYLRAEQPMEVMPHQYDLADAGLTYHYQIFAAEMGTGKGGLPSTKVATPAGWTTLGEIRVGDIIINPDGGYTQVKGVYHRGRMEMFRVSFSDGTSTVCSADHLWNVRSACRKHRRQPYETLELQEILRRGLHRANGNALHYIPMVAPVEYAGGMVPVHPYLAGYILGNGGLTNGYIVSVPDAETVQRLNGLMTAPLKAKAGSVYDYSITDASVRAWIRDTKLYGCGSHEKHLPQEYWHLGVLDRILLLQGLCDSDGYPCDNGGVEYTTTSPDLRDAFVSLIQSLGGTCNVAEKLPTYEYGGERRVGRLAYRIYVSLPAGIKPFWLRRKVERYATPMKYQPTRAIDRVQSIGEHECICIAVEADNGLYVTDDFIVTHNTLSAQMVIENSGVDRVWWVGPKTSIPNIKREFKLWGFPFERIQVEFFTYEGLVRVMDEWDGSQTLPRFFVADESSRCKTATSQRSKACQKLADLVRETYGYDGYVIEMSGTPSPKTPCDWWSQTEIAWPGFLREGSTRAMEERLAFMVDQQFDAGVFKKRIGWKDNERKCAKCGKLCDEGPHELDGLTSEDYHTFQPSKNEVAYLYNRLKGLVVIKHKKDCLALPEKRYRKVYCKPTPSVLRAAQTIAGTAPNGITALTLLREFSDGFQYRDVQVGMMPCTHCVNGSVDEWVDPDSDQVYRNISMLSPEVLSRLIVKTVPCPACGGTKEVPKIVRETHEIPCPKVAALKALLDENEETGRIVIFAGFTGSVDRIVHLCLEENWDVVRCDQGRFQVFAATSGVLITSEEPLDYWANLPDHNRVAFVANPESGGLSLTLVEARMAVYWSNTWKPEYRVQSEDRIHRMGADLNKGCTIVDLIHLPSDERVLEVIRANRKLELMTLGEIMEGVNWDAATEKDELLIEEMTS